jgi:hypothetical protein
MTDLQLLYLNARARGMRHRSAIDHVSRQTNIDSGSVARALARAKRTDERDERAAKREAKAAS